MTPDQSCEVGDEKLTKYVESLLVHHNGGGLDTQGRDVPQGPRRTDGLTNTVGSSQESHQRLNGATCYCITTSMVD